MRFLARLFSRPRTSAQIAGQRLRVVLEQERALVARAPTLPMVAEAPVWDGIVRIPIFSRPTEDSTPASSSSPIPDTLPEAVHRIPPSPRIRDGVMIVRRSIQSGQVIHHSGTVMVFGDVNPAAQVIANGDVIIYGKLRGVVHAGASGNAAAIIAAEVFAPTQARIAHKTLHPQQYKRRHPVSAELARLRGDQPTLEPWGPAY